MEDNQVKSLKLQFSEHCEYYNRQMTTVLHKWENTIEQTRENKKLLEVKHGSKFTSFAVYRVGLKKLFWSRVEEERG